MRQIIIGDIHGCLEELEALLHKTNATQADRIIFVGDLVDRGPYSAGVVKKVLSMIDDGYNIVLVKGNHEDKWFRVYEKVTKGDIDLAKAMKEGEAIIDMQSELNPIVLERLQDLSVLYYRIPDWDISVVHAGIPGDMRQFPMLTSDSTSRERKRANLLFYTRYLSQKTGKMLAMGTEKEGDPFWAEVYDGREGHIVFGHQPYDTVMHFPHATGIDTSCCFGGKLTALILEKGHPRQFVSVDAQRAYAAMTYSY